MPRSYANILTAIWDDHDFCVLSPGAQRTYFMLVTQPDISAAGTLPLTLRRWSLTVHLGYRGDIAAWVGELERAHFVSTDEDTEELLVRTFVRHDGGYKNAKRLLAVRATAQTVKSKKLRGILGRELHRVGITDCLPMPDGTPIEPPSNPDPSGSEPARVVVKKGEYVPQPANHNPQPASLSPVAQRPAQKRGTRLPDDWLPNQSLIDWQRNEGIPDEIARRELPRFRDYWQGKAGRDATKADWPATWRNWLRRAWDENPPPGNPNGKATTKAQGWLDLGRQLSEGRTA